jgi:hypothetical protein
VNYAVAAAGQMKITAFVSNQLRHDKKRLGQRDDDAEDVSGFHNSKRELLSQILKLLIGSFVI